MNWYYAIENKQYGPVDISILNQMVADGRLAPDDWVWNSSMGEKWVEARTVPQLQFSPARAYDVTSVETETAPAILESIASPENPVGFLENAEITRRARASLSGNWGLGIVVALLQGLLTGFANNFLLIIGTILVVGPLMVGVSGVFLDLARHRETEIGNMFDGFKCLFYAGYRHVMGDPLYADVLRPFL